MNSISESFKNNPIHLNYIIPLDFQKALKSSHSLWDNINDPLTTESMPVIDLSDPQALPLIKHACEKWGMFQITNHAIPISLINEVENQTYRLFSLPTDQKLRVVRPPEGCTGYGLARISTFFPKLMWSEGFSIMGSPVDHARQLWPHDHANFCDAMEEYQKEMKGLTERIIGLMLQSLGLSQKDGKLLDLKKDPQGLLQLNSYPICPDPNQAMGLAAHTDSSLLTLLYQGRISGLQVLGHNGGWVPVHPINGAMIVNVGDLMQILSNGRFKSALHRAVVNKTHHRISIAYFHGPPRDVTISPLIELTDHDHPPIYRPVTWKEYLDVKATHFTKALDFIRNDVVVDN